MSLSKACLEQHNKENATTKKWFLRGLLVAAGTHIGLIPLMAFVPAEVAKPPERIELIVTSPTEPLEPIVEDVPIEEIPPEETVEALTEAVAQAELAAASQVSGDYSAPISSFQPAPLQPEVEPLEAPEPVEQPVEPELSEPEPIEEADTSEPEADTSEPEVADSEEPSLEADADEPTESEPEVAESEEESEPDSVETAAGNTEDDFDTPDLNALRDRLRRAQMREGTGEESDNTPTAPAGRRTGDGIETARRDGPSERSGSGTADGSGDGDNSGSTTVSCRRCDRPEYPEEALDEGVEGSPSVSLEYDENGNVIGAVLEQSSGSAALDRAALEAARNYEMDSGGRSGTVSVEIDFGIEGSERSRAAQRRGERESVSTPAPPPEPESEIVQDPTPSEPPSPPPPPEPAADPAPEPIANDPAPEPPAPEPEAPAPAPEPNVPNISPPEPEAPAPEPDVPDISLPEPAPPPPPPEPAAPPPPLPEPVAPPPPEPAPPPTEPVVPNIGPPED